jgi:hypothetical protein
VIVLYKLKDGSHLPQEMGGNLYELWELARHGGTRVASTTELLEDVVRASRMTSSEARS